MKPNLKISLSKLWKTEDWLAVWIGFIIISVGIASVLTGAFDFRAEFHIKTGLVVMGGEEKQLIYRARSTVLLHFCPNGLSTQTVTVLAEEDGTAAKLWALGLPRFHRGISCPIAL